MPTSRSAEFNHSPPQGTPLSTTYHRALALGILIVFLSGIGMAVARQGDGTDTASGPPASGAPVSTTVPISTAPETTDTAPPAGGTTSGGTTSGGTTSGGTTPPPSDILADTGLGNSMQWVGYALLLAPLGLCRLLACSRPDGRKPTRT